MLIFALISASVARCLRKGGLNEKENLPNNQLCHQACQLPNETHLEKVSTYLKPLRNPCDYEFGKPAYNQAK
jgi:hypothetical protein